MALVGDGVFAVTEGVPELDCPVARTGNDLAVVGGEGDGENIVGVADEAARSSTAGELPQAESLVPGGGESVGTVGGDDLFTISMTLYTSSFQICTYTVRDDVGVSVETAFGVTVRLVIAGEVPDDQGLVSAGGQKHVGTGPTSQH